MAVMAADKENAAVAGEGSGPKRGACPKRGKLQTPPSGKRYVVDAANGAVVRLAMSLKSKVVGRLAHCETVETPVRHAVIEVAKGRSVWTAARAAG